MSQNELDKLATFQERTAECGRSGQEVVNTGVQRETGDQWRMNKSPGTQDSGEGRGSSVSTVLAMGPCVPSSEPCAKVVCTHACNPNTAER